MSTITTPSDRKWMYDVFLNFRGEDTRRNFISHLYSSLSNAGLNTFIDDVELQKGKNIIDHIIRAIEGSQISIIVFSKNYAGSSWCLNELVKIMECRQNIGQMVIPVYYDVDPSDVLHQKGTFGEAFQRLPSTAEVSRWQRALTEAANLSGMHVSNYGNVNNAIKEILVDILMKLDKTYLAITNFPVGVEPRVQDVVQLLEKESERACIVGIWGMGGIGKTTVAKAIFNILQRNFADKSFLENIRQIWEKDGGWADLQEKLLWDLLNRRNIKIHSIEWGKTVIKENLRGKRTLVVLDDVTHFEQLNALCIGKHELTAPGSVLIITTRDVHLLQVLQVDYVYEMKEWDENESIELFSWHAFKKISPGEDFIELSRNVVVYCGGLPLALEVYGSFLYERTKQQWESVLSKLERNLSHVVNEKLKISFDGLDDLTKKIFLEICCFFIGKDRAYVTKILDGHELNAEIGITVLIERSLLKVEKDNKLGMHDLLRDMGREIVRQSSPDRKRMYDVFLNFRGEDTRRNFISHLYSSLSNAGVNTFIDDQKLQKGEEIKDDIFRAIEGSQISILVFSKKYAESRWCIDELVKIMECHRYIGQLVIPVFYDVDPSDVRHQKGTFGEAFQRHPSTAEVRGWQRALTDAANLSGLHVSNYGNESDVIKELVHDILIKLDKTYLHVADFPVGVEPQVQHVVQFLEKQSERASIVGICGMGGIGKTTIAKAIYNALRKKFANKSFLENIRGVWEEKDRGWSDLQEQLLSDILKRRDIKIHSIEWGKTMIKENLVNKKTLVVLDDVTKPEQLNALCTGKHELNAPGSVLIITTRDVRLLHELKFDYLYEMKEMDENESLELFSCHAFKKRSIGEDFIELSRNVVAYSGGLPLALQVLGSFLYKRTEKEWKSVLSKLERIPNTNVQEKLKLSFDGLNDFMEKDIFLDICFFFIGKDRGYVTEILDGCELHAEIGITVLIERSLLKVEKDNKLGMHDLLRDMGREIVRQSSPDEPEKRSRLWFHKDVLDVLTEHTGTTAVKGLALKMQGSRKVCLNANAFEKMKKLKLLQLDRVQLAGDYKHLPKQLRWVYWKRFPLSCIPDSFNQENVVAIDLKHSNLQLVWKEPQLLEKLKILNLSHSRYLTKTPDFSYLPNLEKLILNDCPNLSELHHSIGDLRNLLLINIKNCTSLSNLPRTIYKLKSVKTFILSGCLKIEKLEEDIEQMESLTTLIADFTGVKHVPFSIVRSKSIGYISLCGQKGLARDVFPSLMMSWMSPTTNPLSCTQPFWNVSTSHVSMNVQNNNLSDLSPMLSGFSKVRSVWVQCCSESQLSQELRRILDDLCDVSFTKLERTLNAFQVLENCMGYYLIGMGSYHQVVNMLNKSITEGLASNSSSDFFLPAENYPYWLAYTGEGHSVLFQVPEGSDCHMKGMTLCVVYSSTPQIVPSECLTSVLIINHTNFTIHIYKRDTTISFNDEDWWGIMSNLRPGDNVEIFVIFGHGLTVKKTAVYLIYDQPVTEKMESSSIVKTDPSVNPKENIFTKLKRKWEDMFS